MHYVELIKAFDFKQYFFDQIENIKDPDRFFSTGYKKYSLEQIIIVYALLSLLVLFSATLFSGLGFIAQTLYLILFPIVGAGFFHLLGNGIGTQTRSFDDALRVYFTILTMVWPVSFLTYLFGLGFLSMLFILVWCVLGLYLSFKTLNLFYGIKTGVVICILALPTLFTGCSVGVYFVSSLVTTGLQEIAEELDVENQDLASMQKRMESMTKNLEQDDAHSAAQHSTASVDDSDDTQKESTQPSRLDLVRAGERYTYKVVTKSENKSKSATVRYTLLGVDEELIEAEVKWTIDGGSKGNAKVYFPMTLAGAVDLRSQASLEAIKDKKARDLIQQIPTVQMDMVNGMLEMSGELAKLTNLANMFSKDKQIDSQQKEVTIAGRKGIQRNLLGKKDGEGLIRTTDKSLSMPLLKQESRSKEGSVEVIELVSYESP